MAENTNGADKTNDNGQVNNNGADLAALQAELEKLKADNEKLKAAQSNASADASKYKKQLAEKMSAEEKQAAETKELIEQLKADNAALKRAQALAEQKAGLVGIGFEGELAEKAANAFFENDFATFAGHLKEFITARDKAKAAEDIRNTPRPGVGATDAPSVTQEQFDKMTYAERLKVFNEQPELYKILTKS